MTSEAVAEVRPTGVEQLREQTKPIVYPTKVSVWIATPEGFDFNLEVQDIPSNEAVRWLTGMSKVLEANDLKPSSQSQRNAATVVAREEADANGEANPVCPDCGSATEFKNGKGKNGKPWAGYFCLKTANADRNQRHTPVWV